jgi:glycogen operon protein
VHRFVRLLIARRTMRTVRHERKRVTLNQLLRDGKHAWHGVKLNQADWGAHSHSLALSAELAGDALAIHLILNAYWESLEFELPPLPHDGHTWCLWIDTSLDAPLDIVEWNTAPPVRSQTYHAGARSVVMLIAGKGLNPDALAL